MKICSVAKKSLALVLTAAVALGAVIAAPSKAEAKSYKAVMYYSDVNWYWDGGNDGSTDPNKTAVTVKGKKGKATYTVTLKNKKSKKAACQVLCIDIPDLLKKYKKVSVSKVSVKVDGKKVKGLKKVSYGALESNKEPNKFRISIYNAVGSKTLGDKTSSYGAAYGKKFAFKKKISVTFTLKLK
ncbi:MAG: hypothetical protein Q4D32_08380 [Eubacteriales bacterium]|nr:hypothetical protein [Eubacteriales bacterium]